MGAHDEFQAANIKVRKARTAMKQATSMFRRQEEEINNLRSALEVLAGASSMPPPNGTSVTRAPPRAQSAESSKSATLAKLSYKKQVMGVEALEPHLVVKPKSYTSVLANKPTDLMAYM